VSAREIALLVCTGLSNKQIARRLDVTEGTVKMHLHNIYVKSAIRTAPYAGFACASAQDRVKRELGRLCRNPITNFRELR
jgi:DNA-binding NarL/FixJ family response regulator